MSATCNVSTYLIQRLNELGINHLFSVPGDYTSDFLEAVDNAAGTIQRIGNCNELNAGYAADGYARANGLAAVAVTTGVGSMSVLNAVGGSYVEHIPVVVIIGTLSNTKMLAEKYEGELFHHNIRLGIDQNQSIYNNVTVSYELISDPAMAPAQIDTALTACITYKRPVAIEIMEDCYSMPCEAPQNTLAPRPLYADFATLQGMAADTYARQIVAAVTNAVNDTMSLLASAKNPVLWIGKEVSIYGLETQVSELIALLNANWASSLLGKAIFAETGANFIGVYDGAFTSAATQSYISNSDCLVAIGVWSTDLNEFSRVPIVLPQVWASRQIVKTPSKQYMQVSLENFLAQLIAALKEQKNRQPAVQPARPQLQQAIYPAGTRITYDNFFAILNSFITEDNFIVADTGLSTFGGSSGLTIHKPGGFLCQGIWASIGWSVPAGLGASFTPGVRPLVIVGDGAFKLTCQEISTMVQQNCNTVIFVLNNGVYAVEQMLLDSDPFISGSNAVFEAANILQPWDYTNLLKGFSNNSPDAQSGVVNTTDDLNNVLTAIGAAPNAVWLVSINLNERDYPASWAPFVSNGK